MIKKTGKLKEKSKDIWLRKVKGGISILKPKLQTTKSYMLLCLYKTHKTTRLFKKMSGNKTYITPIAQE